MNIPIPTSGPESVSPIVQAFVITPSDTADLEFSPRCLILSADGVVKMDLLGGTTAISIPLQAGFNPIRPTRVYATGTTLGITIIGGY